MLSYAGATKTDGSCKKIADYKSELALIRDTWNKGNTGKQKYNAVKIFSTGDCYQLQNVVTAINQIGGGMKVYAGVWNVPDWKFDQDKAALEKIIKQFGTSWLAGINVGSESLYRKEVSADKLAGQIYGMLLFVSCSHALVANNDMQMSRVWCRFPSRLPTSPLVPPIPGRRGLILPTSPSSRPLMLPS